MSSTSIFSANSSLDQTINWTNNTLSESKVTDKHVNDCDKNDLINIKSLISDKVRNNNNDSGSKSYEKNTIEDNGDYKNFNRKLACIPNEASSSALNVGSSPYCTQSDTEFDEWQRRRNNNNHNNDYYNNNSNCRNDPTTSADESDETEALFCATRQKLRRTQSSSSTFLEKWRRKVPSNHSKRRCNLIMPEQKECQFNCNRFEKRPTRNEDENGVNIKYKNIFYKHGKNVQIVTSTPNSEVARAVAAMKNEMATRKRRKAEKRRRAENGSAKLRMYQQKKMADYYRVTARRRAYYHYYGGYSATKVCAERQREIRNREEKFEDPTGTIATCCNTKANATGTSTRSGSSSGGGERKRRKFERTHQLYYHCNSTTGNGNGNKHQSKRVVSQLPPNSHYYYHLQPNRHHLQQQQQHQQNQQYQQQLLDTSTSPTSRPRPQKQQQQQLENKMPIMTSAKQYDHQNHATPVILYKNARRKNTLTPCFPDPSQGDAEFFGAPVLLDIELEEQYPQNLHNKNLARGIPLGSVCEQPLTSSSLPNQPLHTASMCACCAWLPSAINSAPFAMKTPLNSHCNRVNSGARSHSIDSCQYDNILCASNKQNKFNNNVPDIVENDDDDETQFMNISDKIYENILTNCEENTVESAFKKNTCENAKHPQIINNAFLKQIPLIRSSIVSSARDENSNTNSLRLSSSPNVNTLTSPPPLVDEAELYGQLIGAVIRDARKTDYNDANVARAIFGTQQQIERLLFAPPFCPSDAHNNSSNGARSKKSIDLRLHADDSATFERDCMLLCSQVTSALRQKRDVSRADYDAQIRALQVIIGRLKAIISEERNGRNAGKPIKTNQNGIAANTLQKIFGKIRSIF